MQLTSMSKTMVASNTTIITKTAIDEIKISKLCDYFNL